MTHLGKKITQYSHMVLLLVNQCFTPILKLLPSHSEFARQTGGHVVAICIECVQNTDDFLLDSKRRNGNKKILEIRTRQLWNISTYQL